MTGSTRFPDGFLWGAATSAWQIEGSPLADGAGLSNWDVFAHQPGRMFAGQTADVACDHYRRWERDVDLMSALGLQAYRFSIRWARVQPSGRGAPNPKGLAFYDRLVDRLLERGIQPMVTLCHWDLPAEIADRGGWLEPDIAHWFADYARAVFGALGDRVQTWVTLNEPWVMADAGFLHGVHPPALCDAAATARAAHHMMRAHGAAVRAYREAGTGKIGLVVNLEPKDPASDRPEDLAATARADLYMNRQYLDAAFGRPHDELRALFGTAWSPELEQDADLKSERLDFLGINYYTRGVVRDAPDSLPVRARRFHLADALETETGWEVHPASFTRVLRWVKERYGDIPLYVTENGSAFHDPPHLANGRLSDPLRIHYLKSHLKALHQAIALGVDVRGYFAWSLMDNCEWTQGYAKRFGLAHVDFKTQARTLKASGNFFREVIRTHGAVLDQV